MEPNFGGMPNLSVAIDSATTKVTLDYQDHTELLQAQLARA
jgi:hypothetical protein